MKKSPAVLVACILTGLMTVCARSATAATVLQSFDRLFQGDDPSEVFQFPSGFFQFSLKYDPAAPSTLRFTGYVENQDLFDETGARFLFNWGRSERIWDGAVLFPDGPDYLMGVRFPAADPVQGPVRVPIEFQASIDYAPAWLRFDVEGLGCCDNFRLVGELTLEPTVEPQLSVSRLGSTAARISWSTNFAGFALEYATSLTASDWTAVANAVSTAGTTFTVTVDTDAAFRFFRLRRP